MVCGGFKGRETKILVPAKRLLRTPIYLSDKWAVAFTNNLFELFCQYKPQQVVGENNLLRFDECLFHNYFLIVHDVDTARK